MKAVFDLVYVKFAFDGAASTLVYVEFAFCFVWHSPGEDQKLCLAGGADGQSGELAWVWRDPVGSFAKAWTVASPGIPPLPSPEGLRGVKAFGNGGSCQGVNPTSHQSPGHPQGEAFAPLKICPAAVTRGTLRAETMGRAPWGLLRLHAVRPAKEVSHIFRSWGLVSLPASGTNDPNKPLNWG
jgi:hypothetical protein